MWNETIYEDGDANQLVQTCDPDVIILTNKGKLKHGYYVEGIDKMIFDDLDNITLNNIINIDIIMNLTKINITCAKGRFLSIR